jgi:hypothetical protein
VPIRSKKAVHQGTNSSVKYEVEKKIDIIPLDKAFGLRVGFARDLLSGMMFQAKHCQKIGVSIYQSAEGFHCPGKPRLIPGLGLPARPVRRGFKTAGISVDIRDQSASRRKLASR